MGLKENVIIGKLIPAGTGLKKYRDCSPVLLSSYTDSTPDSEAQPVEKTEGGETEEIEETQETQEMQEAQEAKETQETQAPANA